MALEDKQPKNGPPPDEVKLDPASRRNKNTVNTSSFVPVRILWPALGFPAVIAPGSRGASMATRTICVLLVASRWLWPADVARHLRIVPWEKRRTRHLPPGPPHSFDEKQIDVRMVGRPGGGGHFTARTTPGGAVVREPVKGDSGLTQVIKFARDAQGELDGVVFNGVAVGLSQEVIKFYAKQGLMYLHEIRIDESAMSGLPPSATPYHLFWNSEQKTLSENDRSDEMHLVLEKYAKPSWASNKVPIKLKHLVGKTLDAWTEIYTKRLREYEWDYDKPETAENRTELLHPVFVRAVSPRLRVGHMTDLHMEIRQDTYEQNLAKAMPVNTYHNWNRATERIYAAARASSDIVLMTGDLIDFGRGHNGFGELGQDHAYWNDRPWFLFYKLLATGSEYQKPVYTILGNHDWRIEPYPPFTLGAPPAEDMRVSDDELRKAHGAGHEQYTYDIMDVTSVGSFLKQKLFVRDGAIDIEGTAVHTTADAIMWYLLVINPFLDYACSLPGGFDLTMIDWAKNEIIDREVIAGGIDYGRTFLIPNSGAPVAKDCLTPEQVEIVEAGSRTVSPIRIFGIHAPPLAPHWYWSDDNLGEGLVRFKPEEAKYTRNKAPLPGAGVHVRDGKRVYEFAAKAFVLSKHDLAGQIADKGTIGRHRDWLIRLLKKRYHLVAAGHVHRPNILTVDESKAAEHYGEWLIRNVKAEDAPSRTLPLFVNTTSTGPMGNRIRTREHSCKVPSGHAEIVVTAEGKVESVRFVDDPKSLPWPARRCP